MEMATDSRSYRDDGYTISRAVGDVFGRWPFWPWSVIALIGLGGAVGAAASIWFAPSEGPPRPELRWGACTAYGIVLAALVSVLPRIAKLFALRWALGHRPPRDMRDGHWWPLQLLAAALRQTPPLRMTQQDFSGAVSRAASEARSLLSHRLWPACVAGFVVPVLGLLSAWESGAQMQVKPGDDSAAVYVQVLPQISPPMVATIAAGLSLMIVLAVIDQFTKGLLQHWADTVVLADAGSEFVKSLIGEGRAPEGPGTTTDGGTPPRPVSTGGRVDTPPDGKPDSRITAEGLERLGDLFSSRG
jgi:hypothetical protein